MTDIPVPQARYALLRDNSRKGCILQNKLVLATFFLALFTFLLTCAYISAVGIQQKLAFPNHLVKKEVPGNWIHRALAYNRIGNFTLDGAQQLLKVDQQHGYAQDFKLVCYYTFPNENTQKNVSNDLLAENIDPNLCTHINVGFAKVINNCIYVTDFQLKVSKKVIALKKTNTNLKVLISVGGAGDGSGFPQMVLNHESRKEFIKSIDTFVKVYKFDGVDLDWEFPNEHQKLDVKQKMHFTQLLREIRDEINLQEKHTYLLSVAVAAPIFIVDISYDVSFLNRYVDYINLMSYDYHYYTKYTPFTGLNAPLYPAAEEGGYFLTLNINYSVNYWIAKGMDRRKIIVGLPTYGHSFKLINIHNSGLQAPARGFGDLGGSGFVDYSDVCWFLANNKIIPVFNTEAKSPYAKKFTEWVSYDDTKSLTFKAEYIKKQNLGGAMVLSLNTDDHSGSCGSLLQTKDLTFPLTKRIKEVLNDLQL